VNLIARQRRIRVTIEAADATRAATGVSMPTKRNVAAVNANHATTAAARLLPLTTEHFILFIILPPAKFIHHASGRGHYNPGEFL
jgi:hypothetical protein